MLSKLNARPNFIMRQAVSLGADVSSWPPQLSQIVFSPVHGRRWIKKEAGQAAALIIYQIYNL